MRLLVDPNFVRCQDELQRALLALGEERCGFWLTALRYRDQAQTVEATSRFVAESESGSEPALVPLGDLGSLLAGDAGRLVSLSAPAPGEQLEVFVDPLKPKPRLLLVGGGHVAQAVAAQANLLGFEIAVIEDRPEFVADYLFPAGTRLVCGDIAREVAAFPINLATYVVLVTRGHQCDSSALRACIRRPSAYLGMIGSRRKIPLMRREFLDSGWATSEEFARMYAPIGLDIGAVTVPEIAASVIAQIVSVRRRGSASKMPLP